MPNVLTLFRIVLTFFFLSVVFETGLQAKLTAFFVFVAASLTDLLDGYLARKYNLITGFGKLMDPIADKFLMLSAFFVFVKLDIFALWMFVLIALREIGITAYRLMMTSRGTTLAAEQMGKIKTVFQICAVCLILIYFVIEETSFAGPPAVWQNVIFVVMLVTVILTVVSGISFLVNNRNVHGTTDA